MFEYLAQLVTGIDYFGLGAFPILLGLSVALALIFSNDNVADFLNGLIIINLIFGIGIFIGTKNAQYFIGATILTVLILMLPTGTKDYLMNKFKGEK